MLNASDTRCTFCNGVLKKFGTTNRYIKSRYGERTQIKIQRYKCKNCGKVHRKLPDSVLPFKQYEADVIEGVIEDFITPDTKGFEDFPCEMTMIRWKNSYAGIQKIC